MSLTLFSVIVAPQEAALERVPGRPTRPLGPGKHRRRLGATYEFLDLRQQLQLIAPQEVPTADRVSVKVTAVVTWSIAEPVAYAEVAAVPYDRVYLAVQLALREAVAALSVEDLLGPGRRTLSADLTAVAAAAGGSVGIEVIEVAVKDVLLPADLRAAYAAVVTARQQAAASLESARAETAALRALANGAKLLEEHPALARQRLIEALPLHGSVTLALDGVRPT